MGKMYSTMNLFPMQMGMIIDALKIMDKEVDRQKKNHDISIAAAQSDKYWIKEMIGQMEAGLEECGCGTPVHRDLCDT